MKNRTVFSILIAVLLLLPTPALAAGPAQSAPNDWQPLAPGIDYQKFHLSNPLADIYVTRMDRANPNVTIDSGISGGTISGGTSTTTAIAGFHDQTINYWGETWGNRSDVVAAINGYFFNDTSEPFGLPLSGVVHSGWYGKMYTVGGADAGFTWTMDRNAFIGNCTTKNGDDYEVVFVENNNYNPNVQGIGIPHLPDSTSNPNNLIIYTPQYNWNTQTANLDVKPAVEVLIEMETPSYINGNPTNTQANFIPASTAVGYVRGYSTAGSMPIPFDHIVLSAWGAPGDTIRGRLLNGNIPIGSQVLVKQFVRACSGFEPEAWVKAYAGLGGDYHFLNDGQFTMPANSDAAVRNSRTVISYNSQYVYFVVVDYYHLNVSHGISIPDLATFLQTQLGATDAVSLDSGTSSTMVVNGQPVNYTECTCMRDLSSRPECDLPGAAQPAPTLDPADPQYPLAACVDPDGDGFNESLAATAMMMVVVEPLQHSTTFSVTQSVVVSTTTELRLGPGTNYAAIDTLAPGTPGFIQEHMNNLNGVLAKGSFWWKVTTVDATGWVREEDLQGGSLPPPPPTYSMYLPSLSRSPVAAAAALYLGPQPPAATATPDAAGGSALPLDPGFQGR